MKYKYAFITILVDNFSFCKILNVNLHIKYTGALVNLKMTYLFLLFCKVLLCGVCLALSYRVFYALFLVFTDPLVD